MLDTFFAELAAADPPCLMLDYDGTLAPFTPQRDQAWPYDGVTGLLERIAASGRTRLAVISGRALADVRRLLGVTAGIEFWGSHGAEQAAADGSVHTNQLSDEQVGAVRQALAVLASCGVPPTRIERKPVGLALHWRGLDESQYLPWERAVLQHWPAIAADAGLAVHPFDGGIEIRPAEITKALAVTQFMATVGQSGRAAYLGDDLTDEDAFAVLPAGALGVLVGDYARPTRAAIFLRRPHELLEFLRRWHAVCG